MFIVRVFQLIAMVRRHIVPGYRARCSVSSVHGHIEQALRPASELASSEEKSMLRGAVLLDLGLESSKLRVVAPFSVTLIGNLELS
jgi:hypothetical protein